jgi:hypothetical protein
MSTTITPPKDHAEKVERLRAVLAAIEEHPLHWNQKTMGHCGTSHCFAGFAQLMAHQSRLDDPRFASIGHWVVNESITYLGLTPHEGPLLFNERNTLPQLRRIVEEIAAAPSRQAGGA